MPFQNEEGCTLDFFINVQVIMPKILYVYKSISKKFTYIMLVLYIMLKLHDKIIYPYVHFCVIEIIVNID
jgi:hypothetical protein